MKTLLLADDEEMLRNVLKNRFEEEGWKVTAVSDGEKAMLRLKNQKFSVVVLDLLMPQMDGLEVLKEIKNDPELRNTPIVVLSNLDSDDDIKQALALGAKDYFVKTQHLISEIIERIQKYGN